MVLPVLVRSLWFDALDDIRFPDGKATNALRGRFGAALRTVARPSVYESIFQPKNSGNSANGFSDPPRPFLFRGAHLDGKPVAKHDDFHVDVHVFGEPLVADVITEALEHLFVKGAGVGRGRARLTAVVNRQVDVRLDAFETGRRAKVAFLTPTELKHQGQVVTQPDFAILIRRIRDRVCTLMSLYGPGEPPLDLHAFGQTAEQVRTLRSDIDMRESSRTSGRNGQMQPIGGMVGEAEYAGPLEAFLPYLRAAFYTGVGRHTVWGNGCIETEIVAGS